MIGAGIGVTPYASILNDLVFGTSTNRYSGVACKKVREKNRFARLVWVKVAGFLLKSSEKTNFLVKLFYVLFHCSGIFLVDHSISAQFRVVHVGLEGCGAQRRHQRAGDAHLHHAILPQIRPENDHAGKISQIFLNESIHSVHLRKSLPKIVFQEKLVHQFEGLQSLRQA